MGTDRLALDIPVVDATDQFIRWASRDEVHRQALIHRSVNALIFDDQDRLLLQLRHRDKATQPSCWDLSCSGHVERIDHSHPNGGREASDRSILRELQEELGVSEVPLYVASVPPIPNVAYEFMQLYALRYTGPFRLQEDEVEAVEWVPLDAVSKRHPITRQLRWFNANGLLLNQTLFTLRRHERSRS